MFPRVYSTLSDSNAVTDILGSAPRVYRMGEAPQDVVKPYVTWSTISGTPENQLSGLPSVDRMQVQIDCWHTTDAGAEALAIAVRDAVEPVAHMTSIPAVGRETETRLYRVTLQFDWFVDRQEMSSL